MLVVQIYIRFDQAVVFNDLAGGGGTFARALHAAPVRSVPQPKVSMPAGLTDVQVSTLLDDYRHAGRRTLHEATALGKV